MSCPKCYEPTAKHYAGLCLKCYRLWKTSGFPTNEPWYVKVMKKFHDNEAWQRSKRVV